MLRPIRSHHVRRALVACCLPLLALAPHAAPFSWPGTYHLVGTGFPDGTREAVMRFTQRDSLYDVTALSGPPGAALLVRVADDSAHILWDLEGSTMVVDLHGHGDSVTGHWYIEDRGGPIMGKRR
jgi:hypothetical protein